MKTVKIAAVIMAAILIAAALITVFADTAPQSGDINGDGKVNSRDVIALMKYITGWREGVTKESADFNSDGKVNARDVMDLMKFILSSGQESEKPPKDIYELPFLPC